MNSLFLISVIIVLLPCYICAVHVGNNWCQGTGSRLATRSESYSSSYSSYTGCGWWRRCHRTKYRTAYRVKLYTQYYNYQYCCPRYQLHNGKCKRTVLGFAKRLYYLEKNANGINVCAKKYENNLGGETADRETHTLNCQVALYSRVVASGHIALPPSTTQNCAFMPINRAYRTSGDLRVTLTGHHIPSYAVIQSTVAIIRPREDIIIGFDRTQMSVFEDAGRILICYGIRSPRDLSKTEHINFAFRISTRSNSAQRYLDFNPILGQTSWVSKIFTRRCSSITIFPDHVHEESEEFLLELVGINVPQYIQFNPSITRIKIINERRNLTLGFTMHSLEVLESAGSVTICIGTSNDTSRLYNGLSLEVIIPSAYKRDISVSNSMVRFDGTAVRQCLSLRITNDNEVEGNEELVLTLEVNSTTQPFYMEVNPSYMKLKIIDDDSVVIGFDSPVVEVKQGSPLQICARIHSKPHFPVNQRIFLRITSQNLTADLQDYIFAGGIFSPRLSVNCYSGFTFPVTQSDQQPRTFLVTMTPQEDYDRVIIDPQTVLVKMTKRNTSSCVSGSYRHEEVTCSSGSCSWQDSNTTIAVSEELCISNRAMKKYRGDRDYCTNEGLLCTESVEDKIIRSFNLGISPRVSMPEATTGACGVTQSRLQDCTTSETIQSSLGCQPSQPSTCSNRSILFVLDTSGSVGLENFKHATEAMSELTLHFCGHVQVAVAKFNQHAHLDLCFNCWTESRFDQSRFIQNDIQYDGNGASLTNFKNNSRCILSKAFNRKCGDHTHSDCVDIIYVTDGEDTGNACDQSWLPPQAHICTKSKVFVIGVGRHVNVTKLRCIASPATLATETVFQFDTFPDLLKNVSSSVQYLYKKRKLCNSRKTGSICDRNRIDLACSD